MRSGGPIVAPANLAAASGEDRRATLSWDNSGDDSISRFQYRYRISTVSAWNPDWTDIPGSRWNTTSYTVRSLVNLTGYTFEVRALRGTLEGPASSDTATPEGPPSVPLPPQGLTVHPADRSLGLSWDPPVQEDSRAPVTGYRVRYREEGRSWRTVSRPTGLLGWQTLTGLRNAISYEVQVASVNNVGAGAWTETRGVPEAPQVGEPPPQPQGDDAFDVGGLGVWWEGTDPNGNLWGNERTMDSCAGTHAFTVIWSGPEDDRNAEEWAAHIALSWEAVEVTYTFRRSPDISDYYEMNGMVRLDGQGGEAGRGRRRRARLPPPARADRPRPRRLPHDRLLQVDGSHHAWPRIGTAVARFRWRLPASQEVSGAKRHAWQAALWRLSLRSPATPRWLCRSVRTRSASSFASPASDLPPPTWWRSR